MAAPPPSELPPGFRADEGQAQQQKQMEEQLAAMMNQVCTPEAVDRLARVALVKPEGESGVQPSLMKQPT